LIEQKDVVRMRIPFPDINSSLAVYSHMYICIKEGLEKEFIKCQTYKPLKHLSGEPPYVFIIESADINRNPFNHTSIIDCDKKFRVNNVVISRELLTTNRKDICVELFTDIMQKIQHEDFMCEDLDPIEVASINHKIAFIN